MSLTIRSNISSLQTQRRLSQMTDSLSSISEKLSSGLRINHASDDAAGLAIALSLGAQSKIFSQSIRNVNDGISVLNIADAALGTMTDIVSRMQELSVQAANGSYSSAQRQSLDKEAQALAEEYSRVAATTSFNGVRLLSLDQPILIESGTTSLRNPLYLHTSLGTTASITTVGDGTFNAMVSFATGTNPNFIVVTDVNGDNKPDLLTADFNGNSTSVLLGNGNGTFKARISYATGTTPRFITTADVNGDGKTDIISDDYGAASMSILLANGDGSFQARVSYTAASFVGQPLALDLNADGKIDIVTGDDLTPSLSVFIGNGDGTFKARSSYAGTLPEKIAAADLNGDSKLDIITQDFSSGQVHIYIGNGDGSFKAKSAIFGLGTPISTLAADLNRDGKVDIIVVDNNNKALSVLLGNGNGTFKAPASFATGSNPEAAVATDLNGDGYLDLVTAKSMVFLGNGDGSFKAGATYTAASSATSIVAADVNSDGISDLISSDFSSGKADVFLGNGNSTVSASTANVLPSFTLASQQGALSALAYFQSTLDSLSQSRGVLGAELSRLATEHNVLDTYQENFKAAESRVMDADVADLTAQFVRIQILQHATAAVLAQANQQPALAVQLLRG